MRPLIGIPPCLDECGRWKPGRDYHYVDAGYARAVAAAGGMPMYLAQEGAPELLVERIDGLLLPGGDDLAPPRPYPPDVSFEFVAETQLRFDRALLEAALDRRLPVLAICYGMQLLAMVWGGALLYDLPTDRPDGDPHQLPEADGRHALTVEAGSRLSALWDGTPVNSMHHQAVADPGSGRVCARAPDGVIEAIEAPDDRFALGVQWHPEKLDRPAHTRLFTGFVAACGV